MLQIEGVYLASKMGTMIMLTKSGAETERQSLDYFLFQTYLFKHFDIDKINKILEYLNEHEEVIIDFDNDRAMLVKNKDPEFMSIFMKEMSPETVAAFYADNDGNMDDNNYNKPTLGDDTYVESIYRRQTNS